GSVVTDDGGALVERIERLESIAEIRNLPARYALAVDSRDIDTLVGLYTEDTPVGPGRRGREALRQVVSDFLSTCTTTIHFVGNHLVELDPVDPDRATGSAYSRCEHEYGEQWVVVMVRYADKYQRVDGRWRFYSRRMQFWYSVDLLDRPNGN